MTTTGGGGGWVVAAHKSEPFLVCADLAVCGGKTYQCSGPRTGFELGGESETHHQRRVHVVAPEDAVASLDAPPVALLRRDARTRTLCEYGLGLVAHRGALFYVGHLVCWDGQLRSPCRPPVVCGVWRLAADQQRNKKWVEVARLEVEEVKRLMGLRFAGSEYHHLDFYSCDFCGFRSYGLRELLCCSLVRVRCTQVNGSDCRLLVLLGFNLDTGQWELVHELQHPEKDGVVCMPSAVDLRPDLYMSPL